MIATALAVLMFQQASASVTVGGSKSVLKIHVTDSDSSRRPDSTRKKKPDITASSEQIASAFADAATRTLLERARAARLSQDESIMSYDASTLQRFTIGVGFSRFGRERILFRNESAARVRWARSVGAQIDVKGRRSAAPALGGQTDVDIEGALSPIPYYPGRDALWLGFGGIARETETVDDIINPMSKYAEAYYTYRTGDSITFRLPQGNAVQLREIVVRPRKPDWHAVVGSLWFEVSTGQLVRAAFRMSQPIDLIDDSADDDKPGPVARLFIPHTTASVDAVAIEYGLYQGRFWLPRTEVIEGRLTAGFARLGMNIEEHFTYGAINALDTLPAMRDRRASVEPPAPPAGTDSATARRLRQQFRDSVSAAREKAECDATGKRSYRTNRYDGTLPMMVFVPCDTAALAHSPELPGSLFDNNESLFGDAERDALLARAKSMMPPVPLGVQLPTIAYGPDLQRYNRVEGLSLSMDITDAFAPGMSVRFSPRFGTADRVFNGELAFQRENGLGMRSASIYRRLNASNDWGHPLSFGAGASAFLFGRDEGVYYRSTGAELAGDNLFGHELTWRIFAEKQSDAAAKTNISLPRAFGSDGFGPRENIFAERIQETGASLRKVSSFGIDPNGFRLFSDLRLEGAGGDHDYGRGALDLTVSHPLGRALGRDFSASVTAGAGTSIGELPVQRYWYLGGTNSVRGESIGAESGSSYWLTRTELGYGQPAFRRTAFFDLGWAGDRKSWDAMGRPASGVGAGFSILDGLIRMDLARGLYPAKQWNFALYLDAKF